MRKYIYLAFLLTMSLAVSAQNYYSMVDSAESYIIDKKWDKAEFFIKKALETEPDNNNNSLLLSNLATVQRYQGKNEEAVKNYSIALYMTPNAVTLLKNRASLYLDIDSVDLAYSDYEKVLSLDNKDLEALYNHGMIALGKKKMGISKDDFDRLNAISPKSYYAVNGKATWDKIKGNYSQAVEGYGKIIKARPSVDTYVSRAECYLAMKRLNDAESDIRAAIELDPEDGYLYVLRAKLAKMRYDGIALQRDVELAEKYGISKDEIENLLK